MREKIFKMVTRPIWTGERINKRRVNGRPGKEDKLQGPHVTLRQFHPSFRYEKTELCLIAIACNSVIATESMSGALEAIQR